MAHLHGSIIDQDTGQCVEAKVQVLTSSGEYAAPINAIQKVGNGYPFFYSEGTFSVEIPRGHTLITVERGTEYEPKSMTLEASSNGTHTIEIVISRWNKFGQSGWHAGNTHIHYDEKENRPDERLALDPRVEDLRMTAVSILKRGDLEYATNKYPIGFLTDFSTKHHYVQNGEESRHNREPWEIGYGHIMLLDIRNEVEPISRGVLVDQFEPDYPPLSFACDDTRRQGGTVIWCHNGQGMEAPVAAALGKVDAFNLFDPYWSDPEYDIYYEILNCGIRMPVSTGSDWYICSSNRVYTHSNAEFEYSNWLSSLKSGKTFITNGPYVSLNINDHMPGDELIYNSGEKLSVKLEWKSHYPIQLAEIIQNGNVISAKECLPPQKNGIIELEFAPSHDSWVSARLFSGVRDSYLQPQFAHTSPIYILAGKEAPERKASALQFVSKIDKSLEWVRKKGRFYNDHQRAEIESLFREGQEKYRSWSGN